MYLKEKVYLSKYFNEDRYESVLSSIESDSAKAASIDLALEVGYWRKAYTIHSWFNANIRGGMGVDNCDEVYVDRAELDKLYHSCRNILDSIIWKEDDRGKFIVNMDDINKIIDDDPYWSHTEKPSLSDEWSIVELEQTVDILDEMRNKDGTYGKHGGEIYYYASW